MPYRSLKYFLQSWSILFLSSLWHQLFHKSNQKHTSQQIKKWYTCSELLPTHYASICIVFWRCFPFSQDTFLLTEHCDCKLTLRHPQKSKPKERVSNSLAGWIAFLFYDLVNSSIQRIWYPFRRRLFFKSKLIPSNKIRLYDVV